MAGLWTGTEINSDKSAQTFNQLFNVKAIEIYRQNNGLLYAVLGKSWMDVNPKAPVAFERLNRISGNKIEVKLEGKVVEPGYIANDADEVSASTVTAPTDTFGAVEFEHAQIADTRAIGSSMIEKIQGKEAKTLNYMDDVFGNIMGGLEQKIGKEMNAAQAPARNAIAGWPYMVSDGGGDGGTGSGSGESAYSSYGLTRTDAGNAAFRSYVLPNAGDVQFSTIRSVKNKVKIHGGKSELGVCGEVIYTYLQGIVDAGMTYIQKDEEWTNFGGNYFMYGNTRFILDQYAPDGNLGLLDPSTFAFWQKMVNFTSAGFIRAPHLKAAYVLPWEAWIQFLCVAPARNGKITGITSS